MATLAVAWYPALYELLQCYRLGQNPLLILDHRSLLRPFPYSHSVAAARRLLDAFCDLQIITGTAIIIAGLVNVQTISLYHGNLIINYYSLCLYSFWAGRPSYLLEETNLNAFRLLLRRFTIFVSVVLSATFQGIIYRREDLEWDPLDGKRCYVCHDRSADVTRWFWLFGYCIYGTALISTLHNRTMKYVRAVTDFEEYTLRFLWERIFASRRSKTATYRAVKPRSLGNMIRCHLSNPKSIAIQSISLIIFFLYFTVLQFLAIFSYGTGFYALENSVYTAFAAWTLYNILDFKISNRNLLVPPQADGKLEMSWGFGQVLPVVLLLVLIYQILDIRRGKLTDDNLT